MPAGKRLERNGQTQHTRQNIMSTTGKLGRISSNDGNESGTITDDLGNIVFNIYLSQDNQGKSMAYLESDNENDVSPKIYPKFNYWQCIATGSVFFFFVALLYDSIAPPIKSIGGILVTIVGLLPTIAYLLHWKPRKLSSKWASFLTPSAVGLLLSIIAIAFFCEYKGLRLKVVLLADENPTNQIVETTQIPAKGDNNTEIDLSVSSEQPSPPLPGIEGNKDITDPIIITPHPNELDVEPQRVQTDFFTLINYSYNLSHTPFVADEIAIWRATFINEIKKEMNTGQSHDVSDEIRRNFAVKTAEANNLYAQLSEKTDQIAAISDIIELRKDAYELIPTLSLCNLLADNYYSLAQEYKKIEDQENTYRSYCNAVSWKLNHIQKLSQVDDSFYEDLYFIATVYHGIGSVEWLSNKERIDAHYISACLFSAASQNEFSGGDKQYLSCIYTGMANHNLLNRNAEDAPSESAIYFLEAYAYYTKALDFPSKDQKRIYGFLNHLCTWAEQYSRTHPKESLLEESTVYKELAEKYKKLSL